MTPATVTGALAVQHDPLSAVLARYFPPAAPAAEGDDDEHLDGPVAGYAGWPDTDDGDAELIQWSPTSRSASAMFGGGGASFDELFRADVQALGRAYRPNSNSPDQFDRSSADLALACDLAFRTGKHRSRMARLMRKSGLYREKYDRPDYLPRTIARACSLTAKVKGQRKHTEAPAQPHGGPVAMVSAAGVPLPLPDAREAAPKGLRYEVIDGDPLNSAKAFIQREFDHPEGARLLFWGGAFYVWGAGFWRETPESDVRAMLWDFLDKLGASHYRPTHARVTALLEALKAAAHTPSSVEASTWLPGAPVGAPDALHLLPVANGVLQLSTRTVHPPTPLLFNLHASPVAYLPEGPTPDAWLQFLGQVWPDDPEAIATLQEVFGLLLTPDTSQHKVFLLIGPPRCGKGTIGRVLTAVLGAASVAGPTLGSLSTQFGLAPLMGKLVALVSDARLSGRVDAAAVAENVLRVSGEDAVTVDRKHREAMTVRLGVRFVLLTNELPRIADASGAMAKRFLTLRIGQTFYGREDHGLTARLLAELPGILRWAVEGWQRLKARGYFVPPKSSEQAAQELADLGSPIAAFVRDTCTRGPLLEVPVDALFAQWRAWCSAQGIDRPGTKQTFGRDLSAAFPELAVIQPRVDGGRVRSYRGLALVGGTQWHAMPPIAGDFLQHTTPAVPAISTGGNR